MKKAYNRFTLCLIGRENFTWCFSYRYPDRISLDECMYGQDDLKYLLDTAKECDKGLLKELHQYIEKDGCSIKGNHIKMIDFLSRLFGISEDGVKKRLLYNDTAIEITNKLKNPTDSDYNECRYLLEKGDWDKERVLRFMESSLYQYERDGVYVDIFPTEEDLARPTWETESFLLRRFHNDWGDDLNKLIEEAVAIYPNPKDYDYAGYYVSEGLNDLRYKEYMRFREKQLQRKA